MNIDVRKHIKENFKDLSDLEIIESINETILDNDEIVLPGFGVFFEILWKNCNSDLKNEIISIINNYLKKESS